MDRGDMRIAVEIKVGALERTIEAKRFAATLPDIGALKGFVVDQGSGRRLLLPKIECRGFADDVTWLP